MRKIIIFSLVALLCASVAFAITKKDLAGLKGTWEGKASTGGNVQVNITLEILNDAEPVQAKATLSGLPGNAKSEWGFSDPINAESKNGKLTSAGTIWFQGEGGNFFEITSYNAKDKKISGWFYANGFKANVSASKK